MENLEVDGKKACDRMDYEVAFMCVRNHDTGFHMSPLVETILGVALRFKPLRDFGQARRSAHNKRLGSHNGRARFKLDYPFKLDIIFKDMITPEDAVHIIQEFPRAPKNGGLVILTIRLSGLE